MFLILNMSNNDYHRNLISIIKSDNRHDFYNIFEKIINNEIPTKKYHLDLCLSFLSMENNLDILSKYFVLLVDFYKVNKFKYDISSYPLIIRISSSLGKFKKSIDYLIEMENMKIPIKNRTISPMIEYMSRYFLVNDNLEINIFETLIGIFDKYYKLFKTEQFFQLLIYFKYYLNNQHLENKNHQVSKDKIKSRMYTIFEIWKDIDFISDYKIVEILKSKEFDYIGYELFNTNIIDSTCSRCSTKLKKHELTYLERQTLVNQLYKTYINTLTNQTNHNKPYGLELFKKFIEKHLDIETTFYIIDGGNVGHSSNGIFISDIVIQMLYYLESNFDKLSMSEKIIVILHQSHKKDFDSKFNNIINNTINNIVNSKIKDNVEIWYTPFKENDDIYWLLSSFMLEKSYVITNDKMRDHHVDKLDETLFNRWKQNHIINYTLDISFDKVNQIRFNFTFKFPSPYTIGFQESESESESEPKNHHLPFTSSNSESIDDNLEIEWVCILSK